MAKIERLINFYKPSNYSLSLKFDENLSAYDGQVSISGQNPGKGLIKLHAKGLKVSKVMLNDSLAEYSLRQDVLEITDELKTKNTNILINFSGQVNESMHGIYKSRTPKGDAIISTQFESHYAREAFPCVDEPEAKATFNLTLSGPKQMQFIGNMPITDQQQDGDLTTVKFLQTPIMSTYLLAFAFGKLHKVSSKTNSGVDVSVWSSVDHPLNNLDFALDVTVRTLDFLEEYFGVPYPLPKLDQIAIPDFSNGAMENWGMVTYREIALLSDPQKASASAKELVALVIAHELSHQWFGNLVTMKWWDDLWLNESFATLMEYIVIDRLFPEWDVLTNFASQEALAAFRRDILPGVQAVYTEVDHPDEISTLFDHSIVYAKGARLLWMAYNLVGDDNFRQGLKDYFIKHKYSNTVGDDLWAALAKQSSLNIKSIMNAWIKKPGYPYLNVQQDNNKLKLSQQQLLSTQQKTDATWPIPLWPSVSLRQDIMDTATLQLSTDSANLRLNTVGGHYVVNYISNSLNEPLRKAIANKQISPDSRLLYLNDALLLSKCGVTPITQMLSSLSSYKQEDQEAVWGVISMAISDAKMLADDDKTLESQLKKYVFSLVSTKYQQLGWQTTNLTDSNNNKLRSIITGLAVYSEQPAVKKDVLQIYKESGLQKLDNNTRGSALTGMVKFGEPDIFLQLLELYPKEQVADVKIDICSALCTTKDQSNIDILLGKLKDSDFVRLQDLDRFLVYLLKNKHSRQKTWDWITTNWSWLEDKFSGDKSYDNYPRYAAAAFATETWLQKYKDHFLPLMNEPSLKRNIELGIKEIENKIAWKQKSQGDFAKWLKSQ